MEPITTSLYNIQNSTTSVSRPKQVQVQKDKCRAGGNAAALTKKKTKTDFLWRERNGPLLQQNSQLFKEAQTSSGQSHSISSP